jgi:predicted nucleotidyltransferase
MELSPEQLERIRRYFQDRPVLKAYLFGSFVRGEATETSDVDLLVELDYAQRIGLGFVQMQFDLEDLLQRKVDLVSAKGLSKHLAPYIDAEKRLIYAR